MIVRAPQLFAGLSLQNTLRPRVQHLLDTIGLLPAALPKVLARWVFSSSMHYSEQLGTCLLHLLATQLGSWVAVTGLSVCERARALVIGAFASQ